MNREQLHALLTEARRQVQHAEFVIVGSLAILGAVAEPPSTMVTSIDVDRVSSGYTPSASRFSFPPCRYLRRQYLPPAAVTSRYMPKPSARRAKGLPVGQVARSHSILVRGTGAFLLGASEIADSCPQICP